MQECLPCLCCIKACKNNVLALWVGNCGNIIIIRMLIRIFPSTEVRIMYCDMERLTNIVYHEQLLENTFFFSQFNLRLCECFFFPKPTDSTPFPPFA